MNSTPFQWTTENLFNRERFEAWLANQPGEREFDYLDNDNCLVCGFLREKMECQTPHADGFGVSENSEIGSEYASLPKWLSDLFDRILKTFEAGSGDCNFTIAQTRLAYQTLYGIDLTPKSEPVEQTVKS